MSWIFGYFDNKEDPYNIHKTVKNNDWYNLDKNFLDGHKKFFSVTDKYPTIYNTTPISFIDWIYNKKPDIFKMYIKMSDIEYSEPVNKLLDGYQAKIEGRRIFKTDLIDEIKDCDILDNDHKSYIINKYIIIEFQTIIYQFGSHIKDKSILERKIKLLNDKSERNREAYSRNDKELLKLYYKDLDEITSSININNYSDRVKSINNINDVKRLNINIEALQNYNEIYSNYKLFIDYSKLSNRVNINKEYEAFYYASKNICSDFANIKSEYIFHTLRNNLLIIYGVLYDYTNKKNKEPKDWNVTKNFTEALRVIQFILDDIRKFYPDVSYACDSIEKFIFLLVITLSKYHNIYLYLPTKSLNQLIMVYKCDPQRIVTLIKKSMKREISHDFINNFMSESVERNKNDEEIYDALRKYASTDHDEEGRSQSRVRHISFLFSDYRFRKLKESRNFKYLDLGGGDGSITNAIGKHMKLDKDNIISADVDEWFDNISDSKKTKDISYVTINKTGRLPFSNEQFSVITAFQVFHHIEDIDDRLKELNRIIKRGGLLVIREHDVPNDCVRMNVDIEHSIHEMTTKPEPNKKFLPEYTAFYRPAQEWTAKLESFGFKYIRDVDYRSDMRIRNPTRTYYAMYERI